MNEMLGWYGYDKMNSKDCSIQSMNLVKLREKYRNRSNSTEPETSSDEYNSPQSPTTISSKFFLSIIIEEKLNALPLTSKVFTNILKFSHFYSLFIFKYYY